MVRLSKILKFIQKNLNSSWHIEMEVNMVKKANGIFLPFILDPQKPKEGYFFYGDNFSEDNFS